MTKAPISTSYTASTFQGTMNWIKFNFPILQTKQILLFLTLFFLRFRIYIYEKCNMFTKQQQQHKSGKTKEINDRDLCNITSDSY